MFLVCIIESWYIYYSVIYTELGSIDDTVSIKAKNLRYICICVLWF